MPFYATTIESPLPPSEAEKALRAITREFPTWRERVKSWLTWDAQERPFEGTIGAGRFRIQRIIHYRNTALPIIRGSCESGANGGTDVHLAMHMPPFVFVFLVIWCGIFVTQAVGWIIIAATVLIMCCGFFFEATYAQRILRRALCDDVHHRDATQS